MQDTARRWLPFALLGTILSFLVLITGQQIIRQNANDPQIHDALKSTESIALGELPDILDNHPIAIEKSQQEYTVLFDSEGRPASGSGQFRGSLPTLPAGIFKTAKEKGEVRFTWEPEPGLRHAVVVRHAATSELRDAYILVGRSLKEAEQRISNIRNTIGLVWILYLILSFGLIHRLSPKN